MCAFHYFVICFLEFAVNNCLGFVFCFLVVFFFFFFCLFVLILYNAIANYLWNLNSLTRDQTLSHRNERADSKTLDCQRTPNSREYQLVRTLTKASTCIQDLAQPNASSNQLRMPHPNNKQKHKQNHQHTGLPPHTAIPIRGGKTPPSTRMQAQFTPNTKPTLNTGLTLPTGGRNQKQEEIQTWSLGKGDLKHNNLKKKKWKGKKKYCVNKGTS